jgi:hypothetical protein
VTRTGHQADPRISFLTTLQGHGCGGEHGTRRGVNERWGIESSLQAYVNQQILYEIKSSHSRALSAQVMVSRADDREREAKKTSTAPAIIAFLARSVARSVMTISTLSLALFLVLVPSASRSSCPW